MNGLYQSLGSDSVDWKGHKRDPHEFFKTKNQAATYSSEGSMVSQKARLFLVDHMCVLPYGHNLNALVLFEDAFKNHFSASFCLATRDLPSYAEQGVRVERVLSYPCDGLV